MSIKNSFVKRRSLKIYTMRLFLLFISALFQLLPMRLHAQNIIRAIAGSVLTVQNGANIYVGGGGFTADNGSTITNNGLITIDRTGLPAADFLDNNSTTHTYGNGKFLFTGIGG